VRQLHDTVEADRAEKDNEKWHVLILDELEAAEEWDTTPFQSLAAQEYGRYESLADVVRQIGHDEGVHKRMSLDRLARAR
jgi:hypothetical protein